MTKPPELTRTNFVMLAVIVEGALAVAAVVWSSLAGIELWGRLRFSWVAVGWGVAGTAPLLALFFLMHPMTFAPVRRIREFLIESLGPPLAACRWHELILVAALAGCGEELLFRGVLQPQLTQWFNATLGLVLCNAIFGLLHAITLTYSLLAALLGAYFSYLLDVTGERQLLVPIIAHGLYDYIAFLVVAREYRRQRQLRE